MYSKEESSALREAFWTSFGKYLSPIPSAAGGKINWVNYKTGVKGVQFKMNAEDKYAFAGIDISGAETVRNNLYQIFETVAEDLPAGLLWVRDCEDQYGKIAHRIYNDLQGYTIYNKNHWPELIRFFKENILAFDLFWNENKVIFEMNI